MNTLLASAQKSKSFKLAISKKLSMSISDELRGKMRFSTSEPVASYIIDKVISYAITEVNKNITHTKVNQKCTEFTLGFISSLVSGDRIYFEEDDLNINQSNCCDEKSRSFNYSNKSVSDQIEIDEDNKPSTSIYYDQHKSTCHNHWNEISCPKVSQIDAYESSKIKYEPLFVKPKKNRGSKKLLTTLSKTPKKIFNKISTEQRNLQINPINENATYESESARKYSNEDRSRRDLKINSQKSPNYPLTTQSKITLKSSLSGDKSSKKKLVFYSNNLIMNTNSSINEKTQDPEKTPSLKSQKSSTLKKKPSEVKKVKNYEELEVKEETELPEIKRIREEVNKEFRIKQEELKMEKAFIHKAQLQKKYESKKLKDVDGKKYTFDAEGNQIQIKSLTNELPNNFLEPKLEMNDVKIKPTIIRKENLESSIITGKKEDPVIGNSRLNKKTLTVKHDIPSLMGSMGNVIPPGDSKLKAGGNPTNLATNNIIFPIERVPVNPAGSNFNIIEPGLGVKVKENGQVKEGKTNFREEYGKYSKLDYLKKLNEVNKSRLNISSQIKKTSKAIKKQNLDNLNEKLHTEYEAFKDEGDSIMAKLDRENLRKQKIEISPIKEPILSTKLNMPLHAAIENLNYNVKSNQKHPTGIVILDNPLSTEGRYRTDHGRSFEDFSIINSFNERLLKLKSNLGKDYNLGLNSQSRKVPKKVIHSTVFQRLGLTISHSKLPRTRKF